MNKQIILISIGAFIVGFIVNSLVTTTFPQKGMHQMQGGKMMYDEHMNMQEMMHEMNATLEGKVGDELDQAFLNEMIVHHEGAVEMAQLLLKGTKRPELIKLANDIISAQNTEIEMMKKWNQEWFLE
jgi:uncharacterized protein (DUF305 family)